MTISSHVKAALSGTVFDEVLIDLLEISHSTFDQTFRICNNNRDIIHGGNTYTAWTFAIPLVNERSGETPRAVLALDNVVQEISQAIKGTAGSRERIAVVHKLVTISHPDTIERGPTTWKIRSLSWNIFQVQAELVLNGYEFDAIPRKKIDPTNFPGAFGVIR